MAHKSTEGLAPLQDRPVVPVAKLICQRCGEPFIPLHGRRNRKYCYDPVCEYEREREQVRRHYKRWRAKNPIAAESRGHGR